VVPRTNSSYYVQIEQPSPLQPLASNAWPFRSSTKSFCLLKNGSNSAASCKINPPRH
jgi:hypothetical protein